MARSAARKPARRARPPAEGERPLRVVLTGAAGWLGRLLLSALAAHPRVAEVICLDVREPQPVRQGVRTFTLDLTNPTADRLIADILAHEQVDAFLHAAFLSGPPQDQSFGHELMVIGTMNVLNACAELGIRRLVALSTTLVYGARPDNPAYLEESAPLRGSPSYPYVKDRVEVEGLLSYYASRHPEARVAVLRPCTILGGHSRDFTAGYLRGPIVPTLMGFDPLFQFVHESDVVEAAVRCLIAGASGAFNVVGEGVVPLSSAIRLLGSINLPVPETAARALAAALWYAGLSRVPAEHLDHLRYILIADGGKIRRELGFSPRLSTAEALSGVRGAR